RFYNRLKRLIAPGLLYSQAVYENELCTYTENIQSWLDLGCGHQLLPAWRSQSELDLVRKIPMLVGLDYDWGSLKNHRSIDVLVRGDISRLPFRNDSFDLVTSNMVFEHLTDPVGQLKEILRVLKPGGMLMFHTPNALGYGTLLARMIPDVVKDKLVYLLDGREAHDVFKAYYKINSLAQIERVVLETSFSICRVRSVVSDAIFAVIPPLAVIELFCIRLLMRKCFRRIRSSFIVVLQKPVYEKNTIKVT
ncbi:MAG: class I SAM-dependent methyltransferase, partial [Desulfoprunum sp.]|nr:class I SAM-dependent methyltransferase [Desulfoprunum sp.]